MLHIVCCLYYLYQWCTVKQISDNEIYLLIKYTKSVLWRVAKRLSYIQDARCLMFKCIAPHRHKLLSVITVIFGTSHRDKIQTVSTIQSDVSRRQTNHKIPKYNLSTVFNGNYTRITTTHIVFVTCRSIEMQCELLA